MTSIAQSIGAFCNWFIGTLVLFLAIVFISGFIYSYYIKPFILLKIENFKSWWSKSNGKRS